MCSTYKVIAAALMAAFVFWVPEPLRAQVGTATLSGTVTDPSGAVVSKADVLVESTERKFSRQAATAISVNDIFSACPPGTYQLPAPKPGFRQDRVTKILLSSGQASTLNVGLNLLAGAEQVTVTEPPPLLQTTNATIGSAVE